MANSLADFFWQCAVLSTAILGTAFAAGFVLRKSSAEFRHFVWIIALALTVAAPPAAVWAPKLQVPIAADMLSAPFGANEPGSLPDRQAPPAQDTAPDGSAPERSERSHRAESPARASFGFWQLIATAYCAITALLLLRLILGLRASYRRLRRMDAADDDDARSEVTRIAAQAGVSRKIRILESDRDLTPWTWGALRPVIVVPAAFRGWSAAERRNALIHEVAHIRRFDFPTALFGRICLALYWFQPLVWLAERALRREAEYACDDRVAECGASGPDYANQLLRTARAITGAAPVGPLVAAMAGHSEFAPRVARILDSTIRRTAVKRLTRFSAIAAGILLALPLVTLRSQPAGDSDVDIQALIAAGPGNESELALVVGALIEDGQEAAARSVFAEWLSAPGDSFRSCHYCMRLLDRRDDSATAARARSVLRLAFDDIENLANTRAEPELLMRLVDVVSGTASQPLQDLGAYYLLQARALGQLSDSQEMVAVRYLANSGQYGAALDLATRINEDSTSDYYQSGDTRRWISYLQTKQALMSRVQEQLSTGAAVATATYEYMPAYKAAPVYPKAAAATGTEGDVVVEYTVTRSGRTADARVISSSNSVFDQSAIDSVSASRYVPRVLDGLPIDVPGVRMKIVYQLEQ